MSSSCEPFRILTLSGEGFKATSTLLELDGYLNNIAKKSGSRKPRPCDVFDCIAGIGVGGWLAILLGRFRMDITSCLCEWYKIIQCISPRSKTQMLRMELRHRRCFHTDRLIEQVNLLTKTYEVGDYLFESDSHGVRARHVFVAALKDDQTGYCLFRTYEIPEPRGNLREGPKDAKSFTISQAFGVTAATKYFTSPWTEQMEISGETRFREDNVLGTHDIGKLAKDEMLAIYGEIVPFLEVVNIRPNFANKAHEKQTTRELCCGISRLSNYIKTWKKRGKSLQMEDTTSRLEAPSPSPSSEMTNECARDGSAENTESRTEDRHEVDLGRSSQNTAERDPIPILDVETDRRMSNARARIIRSTTEQESRAGIKNSLSHVEMSHMTKPNYQDLNDSNYHFSPLRTKVPQDPGYKDFSTPFLASTDDLDRPSNTLTPDLNDPFRREKNDDAFPRNSDFFAFKNQSQLSPALTSMSW